MLKTKAVVAGIDLAASTRGTTGLAVGLCTGDFCRVLDIHSLRGDNSVIAARLNSLRVRIAAIDAPLQLPAHGSFRKVEKEFMKLGARLLPLTLPPMRRLAVRAVRLAALLRSNGIEVWETHPRSVLRVSACENLGKLLEAVNTYLPQGLEPRNRHEMDALISLAVAACLYRGCAGLVCADDGCLAYIPHYRCKG